MTDKPVAIVTGASRGIGRAIACELASINFHVIVNFNSSESAAQETLEQIVARGGSGKILRGDISIGGDRHNIVDSTREECGRCDMLVNNAGVAPTVRADILEAGEESFDRVMNINLKGPYFLTQLVANWMIEQKEAYPEREFRICNIGSFSAYVSSPSRGEYCVSKAGIGMMTKLYGDRLADYGINVSEIRPGIIKTDMTSAVTEKYDKLISEGLTPIKRWGEPVDVAKAVSAVTTGKLDFNTAQVIDVDGGFHLQRL